MSINYNVDYYELIGVSETLTGARLKAKVLRFILSTRPNKPKLRMKNRQCDKSYQN